RVDEAEPDLVRQHGAAELSLARLPGGEAVVAHPDVAHQAVIDQLSKPGHGRAGRKQGALPVLLVEVDGVDAEAPRAGARPRSGHEGQADRKQLGGEEDVCAPRANRLADDALRATQAVDLGRVDQVDAEVQRSLQDLARDPVVVLAAVAPLRGPELPRAEADDRDARAAGLDVPHVRAASRSYTIC